MILYFSTPDFADFLVRFDEVVHLADDVALEAADDVAFDPTRDIVENYLFKDYIIPQIVLESPRSLSPKDGVFKGPDHDPLRDRSVR